NGPCAFTPRRVGFVSRSPALAAIWPAVRRRRGTTGVSKYRLDRRIHAVPWLSTRRRTPGTVKSISSFYPPLTASLYRYLLKKVSLDYPSGEGTLQPLAAFMTDPAGVAVDGRRPNL